MAKTNETTRTPAISVEVDPATMTLEIAFGSGHTAQLNAHTLSAEIRDYALLHGLKQKLVDAAAIGRNPDTGRSATLADKEAAVMEVYDRITGPDPRWNKGREGGEGNVGGLLLGALTRIYPHKSRDDLSAWLKAKDDAQRKALRETPRIAAEILAIKAERAKADPDTPDTEAMLDELND